MNQRYAGFAVRFVAWLIDGVLVCIADYIILTISVIILGIVDITQAGYEFSGLGSHKVEHNIIYLIILLTFNISYYVFYQKKHTHTLGKKLMKIKVCTLDGNIPTMSRFFLREVIGKFISTVFLGIGYLMIIWNPKKQSLHDRVANTYVVYVEGVEAQQAISKKINLLILITIMPALLVAGLALGFMVYARASGPCPYPVGSPALYTTTNTSGSQYKYGIEHTNVPESGSFWVPPQLSEAIYLFNYYNKDALWFNFLIRTDLTTGKTEAVYCIPDNAELDGTWHEDALIFSDDQKLIAYDTAESFSEGEFVTHTIHLLNTDSLKEKIIYKENFKENTEEELNFYLNYKNHINYVKYPILFTKDNKKLILRGYLENYDKYSQAYLIKDRLDEHKGIYVLDLQRYKDGLQLLTNGSVDNISFITDNLLFIPSDQQLIIFDAKNNIVNDITRQALEGIKISTNQDINKSSLIENPIYLKEKSKIIYGLRTTGSDDITYYSINIDGSGRELFNKNAAKQDSDY